MLKKYKLENYDFLLVILCCALTLIGIIAIGSAADKSLQTRQIAGLGIGLFVMVFISLLDYTRVISYYWILYGLNIFLLLLVILVGHDSGGAQRWISLFGFTFQPSETAKLILILFYAQFIMKYKSRIKSFKFVIQCLLLLMPPVLLILKQPDLSTSIMVVTIFCAIMFQAGISWKLVLSVTGIAAGAVGLVLYGVLSGNMPGFLRGYQQDRILAWLHPERYANSTAYQTLNSMMAIGSGQFAGKGYNTNEITSVLNGGFISESQTDFIYSVIGEEFGFIGGAAVIVLIFLVAFRCLRIARRAKDLSGRLIACGVSAWIGFQGFMNIGVATGVLPNTGIPLPFVSSGLTSLVSVYMAVGFVLNVRLQVRKYYKR